MHYFRYLLTAIIAGTLAVGGLSAVQSADLQTVERVNQAEPEPAKAAEPFKAAAENFLLYAAPAFAPGKLAWVTVENQAGQPVPGVSVLVNGEPHNTDERGFAAFTVPQTKALSLSLIGPANQNLQTKRYTQVKGLFASNDWTATLENLLEICSASTGPTIWLSPLVVEPAQVATLVGTGFDPLPEAERVLIDGVPSRSLSGSPLSLLFRTPDNQECGPVKALFASSKGGESSNVVEIDVVRTQLAFDQAAPAPGDSIKGSVSVSGTNMPVLVELFNDGPQSDLLVDGNNNPLRDHSFLVTGGADGNSAAVQLKSADATTLKCSVHVVPQALTFVTGTERTSGHAVAAIQSLSRAQLIRLKRRLVSVENRIVEERESRDTPGNALSFEQVEKLNSGLKALSVRQVALSTMLAGQKACFRASGANLEDVRLAEDEAASGAYYSLEKIPPNEIARSSAGTISLRTTGNTNYNLLPPPPLPAIALLAEPRIKLLPPLDMDDLAGANRPKVVEPKLVEIIPAVVTVAVPAINKSADAKITKVVANKIAAKGKDTKSKVAVSGKRSRQKTTSVLKSSRRRLHARQRHGDDSVHKSVRHHRSRRQGRR